MKDNSLKFMLFVMILLLLFDLHMLKNYVDTFAVGYSYGKVFSFVIFSFLIYLIRKYNLGPEIKNAKFLIYLLFIGYIYGLVGNLYLFYHLGVRVNFDNAIYIYNNNTFSGTSLAHSHALKPIFCFIDIKGYDCAKSFMLYLPSFYIYIALFLFLLTLVLSLFLSKLFQSDWSVIAYTILSFSALKTMVDGGILFPQAISFFMLYGLLQAHDLKHLFFMVPIALVFYLILSFFGLNILAIIIIFERFLLFFVPLVLSIYFYKSNKFRHISFILLIISLFSIYYLPEIPHIKEGLDFSYLNYCVKSQPGSIIKGFAYIGGKCNLTLNLKCAKILCKDSIVSYEVKEEKLSKLPPLISKFLCDGYKSGFYVLDRSKLNISTLKR